MDSYETPPPTPEEMKARKRKLRKERAMLQAAEMRKRSHRPKPDITSPELVTAVVANAPVLEKLEIPKPAEKVPFVVGNKPAKKKNAKGCGLTKRLEAAIGLRAADVESVRQYCEYAGIDPNSADVGDCLVHNLFHWAMKGSAPHIKELFERIDGKVTKTDEQNASGKMSITDAMNMLENRTNDVVEEEDGENRGQDTAEEE